MNLLKVAMGISNGMVGVVVDSLKAITQSVVLQISGFHNPWNTMGAIPIIGERDY